MRFHALSFCIDEQGTGTCNVKGSNLPSVQTFKVPSGSKGIK